MISQKFKLRLRVALSVILSLVITIPTSAYYMPDEYLNELYANGVYYYNPCGSDAASSTFRPMGGSYTGGFGDAGPNADKILEALVRQNIPGFSDNPAAIAGVLGNMYTETGGDFNPYSHTAGTNYYGIVQWGYLYEGARVPGAADMIDSVKALGGEWGQPAPSTEINDQALAIELGFLFNDDRFRQYVADVAVAKAYASSNGLSLEDEAAMDAELFEVEVERAVNGEDALIFQPSIDRVKSLYASQSNPSIYYQGAASRRNNAVGALPNVTARVSAGTSGGTTTTDTTTTPDAAPSVTPTVSTSSASIDSEGWFVAGSIPGLQKESALDSAWVGRLKDDPNKSFNTGKATAILLHYTAGAGPLGSSGLAVYGSNLYPAHFTIDLKAQKAYQHFPLNRPSLATKYADQYTIQFEIVGVGYDNWGGADPSSPYNLKNFGDAEWDYLAQYLIAISNYTGIPLTSSMRWDSNGSDRLVSNYSSHNLNLTGVIGHMHVQDDKVDPGNIWPQVQAAIQRGGGATGTGSGFNVVGNDVCNIGFSSGTILNPGSLSALQQTVLKYAWADGDHGVDMVPAYAEAVQKHKAEGGYVGGIRYPGVDCGGWVTILMRDSGWDPNYNSNKGDTYTQENYLKNSANGWQQFTPTNASELQPGDVAVSDGHTWAFVGSIPGFSTQVASASLDGRAPCAGTESVGYNGARWYRKVR